MFRMHRAMVWLWGIWLAVPVWSKGTELVAVPSRMVVDFLPQLEQEAWLARALEQNVFDILAGYSRILPIAKDRIDLQECAERETECRLRKLSKLGVEAYLFGQVKDEAIVYELFDARRQVRVAKGQLPFQNISKEKKQVIIFAAMKPFVEKGGIFDQNVSKPAWRETVGVDGSSINIRLSYFWQHLQMKYPGWMEFGLLMIAIFILTVPLLLGIILKLLNSGQKNQFKSMLVWLLTVASVIFLLGIPFLIDHFPLDLIQRDASWVLAITSGVLWGLLLIAHIDLIFPRFYEFEKLDVHVLPSLFEAWVWVFLGRLFVIILLYAPVLVLGLFALGLFEMTAFLAIFIWLPALCLVSYVGLVSWLEFYATITDRQHRFDSNTTLKIRAYLQEYLERLEIDLGSVGLDRIVFLEGAGNELFAYGGGFFSPRIVIGGTLLEEALSDDHQSADFLFGALLREIGQVYRQGHLYHTIYLSLDSLFLRLPVLRSVWVSFGHISRKLWSRYPSIIADGYVAANHVGHHLLQYYHVRQYGSIRTYQAGWNQLRDASAKIYFYALESWEEADRHPNLATVKHRILWLQEIWLPSMAGKRRKLKTGRLMLWTMAAAATFWVGVHCYQAYLYHPIYTERIEIQKRDIENQKRQLEMEKPS